MIHVVFERGRKRPRTFLLGAGVCMAALAGSVLGGVTPTGCTSLTNVPVTTTLDYTAAIQNGIFHDDGGSFGCDQCHTTSGGTVTPNGELDLDLFDSPPPYANIVNVESVEVPGMKYVEPNHPERSFLFIKINCTDPGAGMGMPRQFARLTPEQQGLIYDWIAAGAPFSTTDTIFRGTFDLRGFVP